MYIDLKLRYFDICNKFIYLDETSSAHVIFNSTNVPTYLIYLTEGGIYEWHHLV